MYYYSSRSLLGKYIYGCMRAKVSIFPMIRAWNPHCHFKSFFQNIRNTFRILYIFPSFKHFLSRNPYFFLLTTFLTENVMFFLFMHDLHQCSPEMLVCILNIYFETERINLKNIAFVYGYFSGRKGKFIPKLYFPTDESLISVNFWNFNNIYLYRFDSIRILIGNWF